MSDCFVSSLFIINLFFKNLSTTVVEAEPYPETIIIISRLIKKANVYSVFKVCTEQSKQPATVTTSHKYSLHLDSGLITRQGAQTHSAERMNLTLFIS